MSNSPFPCYMNILILQDKCSRNTAQKQWDETLVLVLGGIARLLRSFFPFLSSLNNFWSGMAIIRFLICVCNLEFFPDLLEMSLISAGWESLLLFVKDSIFNGSKEVSLAAINCLQTTVLGHCSKVSILKFLEVS